MLDIVWPSPARVDTSNTKALGRRRPATRETTPTVWRWGHWRRSLRVSLGRGSEEPVEEERQQGRDGGVQGEEGIELGMAEDISEERRTAHTNETV